MQVRQARLDDAMAISALFCANIGVWQRMSEKGQVEDLPYEALTIYERWLHGDGYSNTWMSIETAAIFLSHLLCGGGIPLVVEREGSVMAYAEVYHGIEPEPYGEHLHLGQLAVHPDYAGAGMGEKLMCYLPELAKERGCQHVMASCAAYNTESINFYRRYGMDKLARIIRYSLPAQTGQGFYQSVEHLDADPAQIEGWGLIIGRTENARQQWERLWSQLWGALPEMSGRRIHRLSFNASGQEALVCLHQQLYQPRSADVYCWSPKPLSGALLTAIRDRAHREGYRTLVFLVEEGTEKVLGVDAESDPHHYVCMGLKGVF